MKLGEDNNLFNLLLKKYKYFIFDFDGTIINLNTNWQELKSHLSKKYSAKIDKLFDFIGSIDNRNEVYSIIYEYETKNVDYSSINKKILNVLELKDKKFAIFSLNTKKTIFHILKRFDIDTKFDLIISCEDVNKYKPDPQGLEKIISFWKCNKNEVIFIGDTLKDIKAGQKAGIRTILIKLNKKMP